MEELLILISMVISITIVIVLIVIYIENSEKRRSAPPPVVNVTQPLTYGVASNQMFDAAVERFLRTKYGENFYCWKYAFDHGENKKANESNLVLVTLKNGITSQELLKTQDIIKSMGFGNTFHAPDSDEDTSPEDQEPINEPSPVEDWISEHAGDIVTKIEKSLKNNYISILYPVSDEYVSLIDEIVETLNDRMSYEITVVDENTLKINFENLLAYDE